MSTKGQHMCEACGAGTPSPAFLARGRHRWAVCDRCEAAMPQRSTPVFGAELRALEPPMTAHAGWWAYRLACDELGYTLYHTETRHERDALHVRWNQWLGGLMRLQEARGLLIYASTHEASGFLEAWDRAHRPVRVHEALSAWLIQRAHARAAYYRRHPERPQPICRTCQAVIPWAPPGRPPVECNACAPAHVVRRRRAVLASSASLASPTGLEPQQHACSGHCGRMLTGTRKKCDDCKAAFRRDALARVA